jgi:hypothetical protein
MTGKRKHVASLKVDHDTNIVASLMTTWTVTSRLHQNQLFALFVHETIRMGSPVERGAFIPRQRSSVESIHQKLGEYYWTRSYRMNFAHFNALVELIRPFSKHRKGQGKNGMIPFSLKVSSFIRFGAGGAICDIALSHGMGNTTLTTCIWEVMTAIHNCPHLNIEFLMGFAEQKK